MALVGDGADPRGESGPSPAELTQVELDILEFEKQWWKYAGAKESAVRAQFGLSSTRYYQVLNALIDRPEALAAAPLLVRRLQRQREARRRLRTSTATRDDGASGSEEGRK